MSTFACGALALAAVLTVAMVRPVQAQQAYKCVQGGTVRYSDRPCEAEAKPVGTVAPLRVRPGAALDTPAYWRFMSATCREQAESLRRLQSQLGTDETAAGHQRFATQQETYEANCMDEEYRSRERAAEAARAESEQRRAEDQARRAEEQRLAATLEQCNEMRRIRETKRAQLASMSAGERADLQRFEANFTARCQRIAPR